MNTYLRGDAVMGRSIIALVVLMAWSFANASAMNGAVVRIGNYEASMTEDGLVVKYKGISFVCASRLTIFKPGYKGSFYSECNMLARETAKLIANERKISITDLIGEINGEIFYETEVDEAGVTVSLILRIGKEIPPSPVEFAVAMFPPELFAGGSYKVMSLLGERDWQSLPIEKPKVTGPGTLLLSPNVFGLKLMGKGIEVNAECIYGPRPNFYDMRSRDFRLKERIYWLLHQWTASRGEMAVKLGLSAREVDVQPEKQPLKGKVVIVEGKQRFEVKSIFVSKDAHAVENASAKELQRYLLKICGRELPIVETTKETLPKSGVIYVGRSKQARNKGLFNEREFEPLGADGFVLRARDGNILAAGGGYRGTAYAVYRLLERFGCRFYANELEVVPTKEVVEIESPFSITDAPAFEWRAMWGTIAPVKCGLSPGEWTARVGDVDLPKMMGIPKDGFWHHTMGYLLPADKLPSEYLALIGGERRRVSPAIQQYCLSNTEVLRLMSDAVLRWIAENPEPIYYPVHYGDVAQFCECDACKALYAEKGSITDAVIWFVNRIAKEVKRKFPGKFVTTLAYWATRKPPVKERPLPNHLIIFCAIAECQGRPWSHPINMKFNVCKDLEQWIAIHPLGAKGIISFDYPTTYHFVGYPYPALYAYVENLRYYKRLGLRGTYVCGLTAGHLLHLYSYVIPRIMWNPEQDLGKLIDEFTQAWFGSSWKPMREYIEMLHQGAMNSASTGVMDCHAGPGQRFFRELYTREFLDKAHRLFSEAEEIAESEVIKRRILNEKWGLLFVDLFLSAQIGRDITPDSTEQGFHFKLPTVEDFQKMAELLRITQLFNRRWEVCPRWKYTLSAIVGFEPTASPWWSCQMVKELMENPAEAHRKEAQTAAELVSRYFLTLQNQHIKATLVPSLGGRIWRIYAKGIKEDILWRGTIPQHILTGKMPVPHYINFGGYEEYTTEKFASPGWSEKYDCKVSEDNQSATLTVSFPNGLMLKRTITLLPDRPAIEIESELSNNSNQVIKEVMLRAHPQFCFKVSSPELVLLAKQKDGSWQTLPLKSETILSGEQLPYGEWGVTEQTNGMSIINEFDVSQVSACYVYVAPNREFYNLELFSQKKDILPGEALKLKHRYVIMREVVK